MLGFPGETGAPEAEAVLLPPVGNGAPDAEGAMMTEEAEAAVGATEVARGIWKVL